MKKKMMILTLLIGSLMLMAGCSAEENVTEEEAREIQLKLETMKRDTVETTYLAVGEVVPMKQVDIYIGGGGYIESLMVTAGDRVEEDMVLVQLDGSEIDRSNYNATESQLGTVRDNLASQLEAAGDTYDRQLALFEEGLVTAFELDQSRLQVQSLQREYDNARSAYRNQLAIIEDGLEDFTESRLIKSQVKGIIAEIYVEEGEQANGQLGMSIIDDTGYYIRTSVSSDLRKELGQDESVRLRLDGREDEVTLGRILEIKNIPDPQTKLYEVLVGYEDGQDWILGDYVEIEFIIERYEALMVPTASIIRRGSDKSVYLYEEGVLNQLSIDLGLSKGAWVEVKNIDSLKEVVVRGQNQLLSEDSPFIIVE